MSVAGLSECKTVSWGYSLAVNVASIVSPLSILCNNVCIIWIWIFWSNTSSFWHELIFCCSLCIVYIETRSLGPIDIWDMLEDCNDLQLRNISKELNGIYIVCSQEYWIYWPLSVMTIATKFSQELMWLQKCSNEVWCCCLIVTHLASYHIIDSTNVNRVTSFKSNLFVNIDIIWSTCIGCINDLLMPRIKIVGVW